MPNTQVVIFTHINTNDMSRYIEILVSIVPSQSCKSFRFC